MVNRGDDLCVCKTRNMEAGCIQWYAYTGLCTAVILPVLFEQKVVDVSVPADSCCHIIIMHTPEF